MRPTHDVIAYTEGSLSWERGGSVNPYDYATQYVQWASWAAGWHDRLQEFRCCGQPMLPTGFGTCNGWLCEICGRKEYDVASAKLGGDL